MWRGRVTWVSRKAAWKISRAQTFYTDQNAIIPALLWHWSNISTEYIHIISNMSPSTEYIHIISNMSPSKYSIIDVLPYYDKDQRLVNFFVWKSFWFLPTIKIWLCWKYKTKNLKEGEVFSDIGEKNWANVNITNSNMSKANVGSFLKINICVLKIWIGSTLPRNSH